MRQITWATILLICATWLGGTDSDSLTVSRNGKWGFLTDYQGGRVAVAAVDPATGILNNPTFTNVGLFPVSVTVVGTVQ